MDQRVTGDANDPPFPVGPFPVGWRFAPTEEEVVMFLSDKAALNSLPAGIIKAIDSSEFFSKHPKDIGLSSEMYQDPFMGYFLIQDDTFFSGEEHEKKRIVDEIGFWRYAGKKEAIRDNDGNIVAYKIHSTFFNAKPSARKTNLNMEEYWLPNCNVGSNFGEELPIKQCVMARIKRAGRN